MCCSFHNKLKTSYLNGKVNRRVDVLLEVLLKIEHDQYFQYEMKNRLQQQNKIVKRDHCRHKRGMSIPCSKVEVLLIFIITMSMGWLDNVRATCRLSIKMNGTYRVSLEPISQDTQFAECR